MIPIKKSSSTLSLFRVLSWAVQLSGLSWHPGCPAVYSDYHSKLANQANHSKAKDDFGGRKNDDEKCERWKITILYEKGEAR